MQDKQQNAPTQQAHGNTVPPFFSMDQIREKFLSFFEARDHLRMPSFPLVPQNDNSLLLINSGMAPLKPYFTGQEIPPRSRVATCQKCIRTVDIDEVGADTRHGSFFEMLGNFSFGDYFKEEIIPWAWAFLTEDMGIPADRLYVSVYEEDDEAYDIWHEKVGLPKERIFRLGKDDNFWEHGVGPCGPDSEIHYDRGEAYGCGKPDCTVGCDCDRFMEIWNLVFTQFDKREDGGYDPLATRNIDTGMGLERLTTVIQGVGSIFEIDTSITIRSRVLQLLKNQREAPFEDQPQAQSKAVSVNIITDHARSITFMAADGVLPSNEGRGYVLRRLLRRAISHGKRLGLSEPFIAAPCRSVIEAYGDAYPELREKSEYILKILTVEEQRFLETLDSGLAMLKERIHALDGGSQLSGEDAFKLYDTYGFPVELMREILSEDGLTLDEDGFRHEMIRQKERARKARATSNYMGAEETVFHKLEPGIAKVFTGYTETYAKAKVAALVLLEDGIISDEAQAGQEVAVLLDKTPFYAESGGQKGDAGVLEWTALEAGRMSRVRDTVNADGGLLRVRDCIKVAGGNIAHRGIIEKGTLKTGDEVMARVDTAKRYDTARNHTATHLLQRALREVLGAHVEQAGSEVSDTRLRFDFTHFQPMTASERERVEALVNAQIMAGLPVTVTETTLQEARQKGATALFGEKYGETVRMVDISGWSVELCGGTHLANTQSAGLFKIMAESGVASGVRRVEALTGTYALAYYQEMEALLHETAALLKTTPNLVPKRAATLVNENKQLTQDFARMKAEASKDSEKEQTEALLKTAREYNGMRLITARLDNYGANDLRKLGDRLKDKLGSGVLALCGVNDTGAQFFAYASDDAVKKGAHCGKIVKEAAMVCGGNGGGRPNNAQAGGKDTSRVNESLEKAYAVMTEQLKTL